VKLVFKHVFTTCVFITLGLTMDTLSYQDGMNDATVNDYDISVATPAGWTSEYPTGHDAVLWLIRNRESPSDKRVNFEIRVGKSATASSGDIGLIRLRNDFKNLKEKSSVAQQIAGETVPVTTYSFDAATFSSDPGDVTQVILTHGGVAIELRWYGTVAQLTEAAPEIGKILTSIRWLHRDWKPSASQLAFLQAAQTVVNGIAPVTSLVLQYEKAVSLDSNNTKARILLGKGYLAAGRVDDAFSQYQAVSQMEPSNPEAWIGMGDAVTRKGDNATALKYYSSAVDRAPKNYDAHSKVAVGLTYAHRYQEALAHAETAKRLGWNQVPSLDYFIKTLKYQISQSGTSK